MLKFNDQLAEFKFKLPKNKKFRCETCYCHNFNMWNIVIEDKIYLTGQCVQCKTIHIFYTYKKDKKK